MPTNTPNMGLVLPIIGGDSGLTWEQSVNANSQTLDQHNHAAGSGVQITPAGLSISADLPFLGNNGTQLRSVRFNPQISPLSGGADLGCLYVSGVDLFFNDVNGNQIQITSGAAVNATSSGISSGTATASFSAGVLVVNAATNTPANIQGASLLLGNNVANSKYLTLSPPSAMAANYGLVLPAIPGSQSFMTIDASGNIAPYAAIAQGIMRTNLVAVGQQISSSCGTFTTNSNSATAITNLHVAITTTGRPVAVFLQGDGSAFSYLAAGNLGAIADGYISIYRGSILLASNSIGIRTTASGTNTMSGFYPPSSVFFLDTPTAGTYTYTAKAAIDTAGTTITVENVVLVAYEL